VSCGKPRLVGHFAAALELRRGQTGENLACNAIKSIGEAVGSVNSGGGRFGAAEIECSGDEER